MTLQKLVCRSPVNLLRRSSVQSFGGLKSMNKSQFQLVSHIRNYHPTNYAALSSSSSPKVDNIFEKILDLDTIEVHLLTELVNEKMGFKPLTAAQREAMGRGGGKGAASTQASEEATEKEEKTAFDVKLTEFDAKAKIKVIKEIRAITGLGLKEAKELVEGAPKVIKNEIKMDEAEEIKAKLEGIGAKVEIL